MYKLWLSKRAVILVDNESRYCKETAAGFNQLKHREANIRLLYPLTGETDILDLPSGCDCIES